MTWHLILHALFHFSNTAMTAASTPAICIREAQQMIAVTLYLLIKPQKDAAG